MDDLRFVQVFGDNGVGEDGLANEADIVSTLEFDSSGEFLAVGDKGGRVVVFQKLDERGDGDESRDLDEAADRPPADPQAVPLSTEYRFFTEFQSHEPEFDYLKSLEIEEKINKLRWLPPTCDSLFILSTNDKTIKLWKMREKKLRQYEPSDDPNAIFPQSRVYDALFQTSPRRIFGNGHVYHINSISVNSDQETFISADDLRVNLWQLETTSTVFNIVDIKPENMEDLSEVITAAEFHPENCNSLIYSSSKGTIKLADMRASALCDEQAKVFYEEEDPASRSFFSEVLASISDIKFSPDARYILSRDYLTLKLWDVNMENHPVRTIHIHDYLRPKLCELYENDLVFDKFECGFSQHGKYVTTGSYDNNFHVYDREGREDVMLKASRAPMFRRRPKNPRDWKKKDRDEPNSESIDYNKKVLHLAFHPSQMLMAIGALNNLYVYAAPESRPV